MSRKIIILFLISAAFLAGIQSTFAQTPSSPTNLTVTPEGCSSGVLDVVWDAMQYAVSYKIYRNGTLLLGGYAPSPSPSPSGSPSPSPSGSPPPTRITYRNTGLPAVTLYNYQVSAVSSGGVESALSAAVYQFSPNTCPAFSITNGGSVSTETGDTGVSTITATYSAGDPFTVSFSEVTTPTGTTHSLSASSCNISANTTYCAINYNVSGPVGSYSATITGSAPNGSGGNITHNTVVPITIYATSQAPIPPITSIIGSGSTAPASQDVFRSVLGTPFVVTFTNNATGYTCSKYINGPITTPSFSSAWSSFDTSAGTHSGTFSSASTDPLGQYTLSVTCNNGGSTLGPYSTVIWLITQSFGVF